MHSSLKFVLELAMQLDRSVSGLLCPNIIMYFLPPCLKMEIGSNPSINQTT